MLAHHNHGTTIEARETRYHRGVIAEGTVAVKLDEVLEQTLGVVLKVRSIRMATELDAVVGQVRASLSPGDRLVVVSANQIDPADLPADPNSPFRQLSWVGPVSVGLLLPTDVNARNTLLFRELGGKPSETVPRLYVPYAQVAPTLIERGRSIDKLRAARERTPGVLQHWLGSSSRPLEQLLWLPLQARKQDMVVIIDKSNAQPLVILDIEPW